MLATGVKDQIGWLHPDGTFYPASDYPRNCHIYIAEEIIRAMGDDPDTLTHDEFGYWGAVYNYMYFNGWVRVEYYGIEGKPNEKQLVTITKLYQVAKENLCARYFEKVLTAHKIAI